MKTRANLLPEISARDLSRIHSATVNILNQVGMVFDSNQVLEIFRKHGFKIEGKTVFFTEKDINTAISQVPNEFTILARNPKNNLHMDMNTCAIGAGRAALFVMNTDGQRRCATTKDHEKMARLAQSLDGIQHWGPLVYPNDVPAANVPIYFTLTEIKLLDKPYTVFNHASVDLLCLAFGINREQMKEDITKGIAYSHSTVNPTSPLMLIEEQCDFLIDMAESGIPLHISPSPSAGTTGPVTLSGTLVLQNCEILATLVLTQLVRPGLPITYGTIACGVDMRNMAALYGSPEARLMEIGAAQIARFYGLLSRGDVGFTDALNADFQAGAESTFQFMNTLQSGINFLPGCGLLASMLSASTEKLYLDAEIAGYMNRYFTPMQFTDDDLAVDVIKKVGSGGQFLTEEHTFTHFKDECYSPLVFSRMNYDNWEKEERRGLLEYAREKVEAHLHRYQPPFLDGDIAKEVDAYAEKNWPVK